MATHVQDIFTAIAGLILIIWVISDVFQSIIVPHYRPSRFRLSHILTSRILWIPLRTLVARYPNSRLIRDSLPMFAPFAMMTLLACWLTVMMLGYSLILWAERTHIAPHLKCMEDSIYFAATSVLTVGFGDVVACTFLSRATVVCAAVSGIVLLALTVSFLFSTQSHFHGREVNSQIISARSQQTCDGLLLFENLRKKDDASSILELCERWMIDIYQSHTSYPLLMYFRSRSSRISWLSQMGAVLDTAALILAVGPDQYRDIAHSIFDAGTRALAVFANRLTLNRSAGVQSEHYVTIFRALKVPDAVSAATRFASYRQVYFGDLQVLCEFFVVAPPAFNVASLNRLDELVSGETLAITAQHKRVSAPGSTQEFLLKRDELVRK